MSHAVPDTAPAVLITGAAAGIGRATARQLAVDGWHCVLVDHHEAALQALQADWPANALPPTLRCLDLSDATAVRGLGDALPTLSALINNAGLSAGGQDALGPDEALTQRLLAVNLAAPARVVQSCAARLKPGARIVNVASGAGLRAIPWRGLYSASKAGLIAQTQALAQARPDWTVNTLVPGFVRTELVQGLIDQGRLQLSQALAKVPLGHLAEASDMAQALRFLVSPDAAVLQGQALVLDGGSSVYGGAQALPSAHRALPAPTLPLALTGAGGLPSDWIRAAAGPDGPSHTLLEPPPPPAAHASYPAVCDARALHAGPGGLLQAVRGAAQAFRQSHQAPASLTLLLPAPNDPADWTQAGDAAAARMLIATLAAEWGAEGLRINALQLASDDLASSRVGPLLRYVASPLARLMTGQCLTLHPHGRPAPVRPKP